MTFTRDLETEGHVLVYVTCLSLLVFIIPRWFVCCFVRFLGLGITEFIPTIAVRVTITRDLETEGHVTVYVTFVISACICPTEMIVFLFSHRLIERPGDHNLEVKWLVYFSTFQIRVKSLNCRATIVGGSPNHRPNVRWHYRDDSVIMAYIWKKSLNNRMHRIGVSCQVTARLQIGR